MSGTDAGHREQWVSLPYPFPVLPDWHLDRLAQLVQALGDPPVSVSELASLALIVRQQDPDTVHNLTAVIRRARAATLCWVADEYEPDLDDPHASHGELSYREGVAHVCHALRERARELDGGSS